MDPDRSSQRTERSPETWRSHIIRQLKHRDLSQTTMFQDLMRFYTQLLEKTSLTKAVLSSTNRRDCADSSSSLSSLQEQTARVKKITGELAYQVVELQQQIQIKTCFLQDQQASLQVEKSQLEGVLNVRQTLQKQVDHFNLENRKLKEDYDTLLERQRWAESKLREEKVQEEEMLEKMLQLKNQAAAQMNNRNERRSRARQATLQKDLQMAARSKVTIDSSSSAPSSRSTSPKPELPESRERRQTRLFRSASVASPRMFSSFRELFEKRRGHSVSSPKEDLLYPVGFCVSARVPARSLQVLALIYRTRKSIRERRFSLHLVAQIGTAGWDHGEAHEQGINAVRFSFSSDLLATGGTDRVVKLWELRAGSLTHRATLDGSTEGITSVAFDHMGQKVLAASYDKSALLWRVDDSVPKVTLTGHSRKVTAARFTWVSHQVVTGSLDRTIRLWDLQRTACVQQVEVVSSCSDLVCSENSIISGHFDCKIRVWDSRVVSCIQELPAQGRVTSLDLSYDRRQLLSCCRDDCLQLVDLRRWSNERLCFRAEGFICGSDSTRAVISPDGCYLAAGSADGAVYIWNVSTGTLETRLPDKHSSSISAVSWAPSGEYVVSVDRSRRAVLWSDI